MKILSASGGVLVRSGMGGEVLIAYELDLELSPVGYNVDYLTVLPAGQ